MRERRRTTRITKRWITRRSPPTVRPGSTRSMRRCSRSMTITGWGRMILVSSQEARNINKKVIANSGAPLVRFTKPADDGNMSVVAGTEVRAYFNKFTGQVLPLVTHPNLPAGTMLGVTTELPYPLPDISNVFRIKTRREYYEVRWPVTTRRYDHGVYATELLQHYAPFSMFLIQNIQNG